MTEIKAKVESQIDKFKEMAKEHECNESEKDFNRKLGKPVKDKPSTKSSG